MGLFTAADRPAGLAVLRQFLHRQILVIVLRLDGPVCPGAYHERIHEAPGSEKVDPRVYGSPYLKTVIQFRLFIDADICQREQRDDSNGAGYSHMPFQPVGPYEYEQQHAENYPENQARYRQPVKWQLRNPDYRGRFRTQQDIRRREGLLPQFHHESVDNVSNYVHPAAESKRRPMPGAYVIYQQHQKRKRQHIEQEQQRRVDIAQDILHVRHIRQHYAQDRQTK